MRKLIAICFLTALVCAHGAATEPSLLPDSFGSWRADGPATLKSGAELLQGWGDVNTDGLREAGVTTVESRNYVDGTDKLPLRLCKFKDTSGAYEFYTQTLAPAMQPGGIGDESAFERNHGIVLIGNFVAIVGPWSAPFKPDTLESLVPRLKVRADATPYPPLRSYLPTRWRVFGTEKYSLGPAGFNSAMDALGLGTFKELAKEVGFQDDAEAILARY